MNRSASIRIGGALAGLTAIVVAAWYGGWLPKRDPLKTLLRAQPAGARRFEARVTGGFRWAPHRGPKRGDGPSIDPALTQAASEIFEASKHDGSPRMRHAAAVATLLTGRVRDAAAALPSGIAATPDAATWSDLAAARYSLAAESDD